MEINIQKKRKRKLMLKELTKYGIIEKDGIIDEQKVNIKKHLELETRDKNKRINEIKSKEIDKQIGKNIKNRRKYAKMSLISFSNLLGISHQQLHKYEKGINRISSSTLFIVSNILQVPVGIFYINIENIYEKEQSETQTMKMIKNIYELNEKQINAVENLIINLK